MTPFNPPAAPFLLETVIVMLMAWRLFTYLQKAGVGSILATVCTGAVMFFVMLVGAFVIAGMYG